MKKLLCMLILLVLMAPAGLAKSWVEDTSMRYDYRYTEFGSDVPQDFAQALADGGYDPADVVCGAGRAMDRGDGISCGWQPRMARHLLC